MGQPNVSNDDDDFVDPPPRRQDSPPVKNLQLMKHRQLPIILQMNHTLTCHNGLTKGKGKIDPSEDISTLYSLQPPSFDLGIEYTQPDDVHSEDIQKQGSTSPHSRSELPIKRVSRPARILQSPFVVGEGILFKHDDHVLVFEHFKGDVEEVNRSTFMSWFRRSFKPKNKKKFNNEDDKIKSAFVIGSFPVGRKSWFYNLIHTESSLSSTVQ
ncbi:Hypothetical predicted protein [Olea europaea subsp. europaea]|uniref:Uncharacterized protein n=1 Tax=Olea europaea subsp. europaea TaxID=158383 RepID=A0A8S0V7U1_OLEEU|nr:Hypothetical predicted protein [Olea europaea subsp. europaea]